MVRDRLSRESLQMIYVADVVEAHVSS